MSQTESPNEPKAALSVEERTKAAEVTKKKVTKKKERPIMGDTSGKRSNPQKRKVPPKKKVSPKKGAKSLKKKGLSVREVISKFKDMSKGDTFQVTLTKGVDRYLEKLAENHNTTKSGEIEALLVGQFYRRNEQAKKLGVNSIT